MPTFNLGTTPSNTVNSYYGPWSTDWAISSKHATPSTTVSGYKTATVGSTNTSPTSVTGIGVTSVNLAIGSETTPNAQGRGRIWSDGGSHIAQTSVINVGTDSAQPMSIRSFAFSAPVIVAPSTTYRFGFNVSTGTDNSRLNYDWDSTSGYNVEIDTSVDADGGGSFTVNKTVQSGAQLVGNISYFTFPEPPTISTSSTTSSISITVADGSTTNSGAITGFLIQYKLSTDTVYTTYSSNAAAGTHTISGLTPGLSYNIRVGAKNAVSEAVVEASGEVVTGGFATASQSVKTFGNRFTNDSGANSTLSTIKRFVGIGVAGADANGYVNLTIGRRYNGTIWTDIG
jgi:hypothetical protein